MQHSIRHHLFQKYCQSQNYYYTRDINEILSESSTTCVIHFKDYVCFDEEEEYLKRFYKLQEHTTKITLLSEYYKFHTDIGRIFQEPVATMLNKYYDKKRKYEYYRIAKLIEEENKRNPQKPPKGIVGERPSANDSSQETQSKQIQVKSTYILKELSWLTQHHDVSNTLHEICKQITNCDVEQSTLKMGQILKTEELKLDNFLTYMNRQINKPNRQQTKLSVPQEQLIQSLLQQKKNMFRNQQQNLHQKQIIQQQQPLKLLNHQHSVQFTKNFVKNQIDYLQTRHKKLATETTGSITKLESKINESIKSKQKIIVPTKTTSPSLTTLNSLKNLKVIQQKQLNVNYLAKLLIEDDPYIKSGAQTHRPISGTKNFFTSATNNNNSNRVSPQIRQMKQQSEHQKQKQQSLKGSMKRIPVQNIHLRQQSHFDLKLSLHKKHQSDGRAFWFHEQGSQTERTVEQLFKNIIATSPKKQQKYQTKHF